MAFDLCKYQQDSCTIKVDGQYQSKKFIQAVPFEVSCLQGFQTLTTADPSFLPQQYKLKNITKQNNNKDLDLTMLNPNTKSTKLILVLLLGFSFNMGNRHLT